MYQGSTLSEDPPMLASGGNPGVQSEEPMYSHQFHPPSPLPLPHPHPLTPGSWVEERKGELEAL